MKENTLYDYLEHCETGNEIIVKDKEYETFIEVHTDIEIDGNDSLFKKYTIELMKLLTVKQITKGIIIVNLSEVIKSHIKELKESGLFVNEACRVGHIMYSIDDIISGHSSEGWFVKFVEILKQ